MTPLQNMTIAQLESKAAEYVEKYDDRFKHLRRRSRRRHGHDRV